MTGRPRSAGSATVLPSASRSSARAAGAAPCSGTRFSPATRSSSVAPSAGAAASKASASAASMAGMVLRDLMPYSRGVDRLADVEAREEELELGVLDGVGGQHVRPQRRHAPLEALAHVPDLVAVRAPRREVARHALGDVGEPPAAEELVRAALGRVAVGAGVVAL